MMIIMMIMMMVMMTSNKQMICAIHYCSPNISLFVVVQATLKQEQCYSIKSALVKLQWNQQYIRIHRQCTVLSQKQQFLFFFSFFISFFV